MKRILNVAIVMVFLLYIGISSTGNLSANDTQKEAKPKFKLTFIERIRFEGWDNTVSLSKTTNDSTAYTRFRTSLMAQWFPNANLELGLRFTNEFRYYFNPKNQKLKLHEGIIDSLYAKWKLTGEHPMTITLGRQDMLLGEGFVVADGTPLDGSRSYYFNAARFDYSFNSKHQLTTFVNYESDTDDLLPVIAGSSIPDQALNDQPEWGIGAYYTGKFNKTVLEGYAIFKYEKKTDKKPIKSTIETLGARLTLPVAKDLSLTSEAAIQGGKRGDANRTALGGYFHLDYKLDKKVPLLKTITFGGIHLDGDNPNTAKYEGWNPLFSRWPKWSDSYIYTFIRENGVANWTNLNSIYFSLLTGLGDPMTLRLTWHHLTADNRKTDFSLAGTGKTRGNLLIGRIDFPINKYTVGRFIWEYFAPGNYYFKGASGANWIQFELLFKL